MAKVRNPTSFSSYFKIDCAALESSGILNPLLNADTKLFIDPLLLETSNHKELSDDGAKRFRKYLETLVTLLKASSEVGDPAWREAERRMSFQEVASACLGYGAASVHGAGFGPAKRAKVLHTAKHIIRLGVEDPQIFLLIPLLEEGVGPDLISDMVTRIIQPDLAALSQRILAPFQFTRTQFTYDSNNFQLPQNPFVKRPTPVLLVPKDILSKLPVATDWTEIADAASKNAAIRKRVNDFIGNIWVAKTRRDKARLRSNVLHDRQAVEALLATIRLERRAPYDFQDDPLGLLGWRQVLETVAMQNPLTINRPSSWNIDKVFDVVRIIVEQFKFLVEEKGHAKLLWHDGKPHHEEVAQRLFFGIAHSYCVANSLDLTPEADTGNGVVDFKFSAGAHCKVLIETKLSTNKKLLQGYETQLETYKRSEQTLRAVYLVVNVGQMGKKDEKLVELRNALLRNSQPASDLVFVDGHIKPSASKR